MADKVGALRVLRSGETIINHFHMGPLDRLMAERKDTEEYHGFEREVESMKLKGCSEAKVAVAIVEKWLLRHGYYKTGRHLEEIRVVSGCEGAGLTKDTPYLTPEFWDKKLKSNFYTAQFWDELFLESRQDPFTNISNFIPDNGIERMVLYFLREWRSKIYSYITDDEVPEEFRLAVLRKQLENFTFIYRKTSFGNIWKMSSEPNELLLNALEAGGSVVLPELDLQGRQVTVKADLSIPKSAGEGPTPDDTDREIYRYIVRYAKQQLGHDKVHNSWSMVRASFKSEKGVDVRCYAFSGHKDSGKDLHRMPQQWFKEKSSPDAFGDQMEVNVSNVDCQQLGQNMVLAVFRALKSEIEEDLKSLTTHCAFQEGEYAEALISEARKDMFAVDYVMYFNCVQKEMNNYEKRLTGAIKNIVENKMKVDSKYSEPHINDVFFFVSVGLNNKSFSPSINELKKYLQCYMEQKEAEEILAIFVKISEKHTGKLKGVLDGLPNKFLSKFEELLKTSECGEDNVIALVLQKVFSQYMNSSFLKANVQFVSLDSNHMEGKPFCSVCGRKVNFYSILPFFLRFIGHTGNDCDKIATLFNKLNLKS